MRRLQAVVCSVVADDVSCGDVDIAGASIGDGEGAVAHDLGVDVVARGAGDGAGAVACDAGTEHEPPPTSLEQTPLLTCDGFELSPVALEQMPLPLCDSFELLPGVVGADAITRGA